MPVQNNDQHFCCCGRWRSPITGSESSGLSGLSGLGALAAVAAAAGAAVAVVAAAPDEEAMTDSLSLAAAACLALLA